MPGRVIADCTPDIKALGELGINRIAVWGSLVAARTR
jgi:hypothetical protein